MKLRGHRELLIIVPTRSRPEAVPRVVEAWVETGAFDVADLLFAYDFDDPRAPDYERELIAADEAGAPVHSHRSPVWQPMVHKLNRVARIHSLERLALGFAGDDHLPRSYGWAVDYIEALRSLGTGIVYGDDGYQHENLPTQWAMTSDIVRALGRMVPAPVEHLYCDNAIRDLGLELGAIHYLQDVLIEHMHPVAGKVATDAQYEQVNGSRQYATDRRSYRQWRQLDLPKDVAWIRAAAEKERTP